MLFFLIFLIQTFQIKSDMKKRSCAAVILAVVFGWIHLSCEIAVEPAYNTMTGDEDDKAGGSGEIPQEPIPDEGN